MTITQASTSVGMGEIAFAEWGAGTLACVGLGSCIGLTAYDRFNKLGGMVHIVLPSRYRDGDQPNSKFADSAVPALIEGLVDRGAFKSRLVFKMAGGAQLATARSGTAIFEIGERNANATREALALVGAKLSGEDVGGRHGRTVKLDLESGMVTVSSAVHGEKNI